MSAVLEWGGQQRGGFTDADSPPSPARPTRTFGRTAKSDNRSAVEHPARSPAPGPARVAFRPLARGQRFALPKPSGEVSTSLVAGHFGGVYQPPTWLSRNSIRECGFRKRKPNEGVGFRVTTFRLVFMRFDPSCGSPRFSCIDIDMSIAIFDTATN